MRSYDELNRDRIEKLVHWGLKVGVAVLFDCASEDLHCDSRIGYFLSRTYSEESSKAGRTPCHFAGIVISIDDARRYFDLTLGLRTDLHTPVGDGRMRVYGSAVESCKII